MYRVFNMGVGMVLAVGRDDVSSVQADVPEARLIGEVVAVESGPRVVLA
jgi:phosphoribosylformylglycinamidine cyclo-ligase